MCQIVMGQTVETEVYRESAAMQENWVPSLSWEELPGEGSWFIPVSLPENSMDRELRL